MVQQGVCFQMLGEEEGQRMNETFTLPFYFAFLSLLKSEMVSSFSFGTAQEVDEKKKKQTRLLKGREREDLSKRKLRKPSIKERKRSLERTTFFEDQSSRFLGLVFCLMIH